MSLWFTCAQILLWSNCTQKATCRFSPQNLAVWLLGFVSSRFYSDLPDWESLATKWPGPKRYSSDLVVFCECKVFTDSTSTRLNEFCWRSYQSATRSRFSKSQLQLCSWGTLPVISQFGSTRCSLGPSWFLEISCRRMPSSQTRHVCLPLWLGLQDNLFEGM